jgi:hypothetical protein
MDPTRFDRLTRALTTPRPRRALAALAAGGLLAARFGEAAAGCGPCERQRGARCRRQRDGVSCNGSGVCVAGGCRPHPTCARAGATCPATIDCCSKRCAIVIGADTGTCVTGAAGTQCRTDADCASGNCDLYRCR